MLTSSWRKWHDSPLEQVPCRKYQQSVAVLASMLLQISCDVAVQSWFVKENTQHLRSEQTETPQKTAADFIHQPDVITAMIIRLFAATTVELIC